MLARQLLPYQQTMSPFPKIVQTILPCEKCDHLLQVGI
jgi:hypothetical protein